MLLAVFIFFATSAPVAIVPKDLDPSVLPLEVRLRRYLIRNTPEQSAAELSNTLQAA